MKLLLTLLCGFVSVATLAQEATTTQSASEPQSPAPSTAATDKPATSTLSDVRSPQPKATRADRLDLDTTIVTGNRELPKVLYIVPWKKAEIGDLPAQPFNTLLDEVLAPVDRDVFKREVKYFHTVTQSSSTAAPNTSGEKGSADAPR